MSYTTLQGKGCPARKSALHTAALMKWWLIVSPSHYQSASLGSVFQAWVLLKSLSLVQCCAIDFKVEQLAPLTLEQYRTM